MFSLLQFLDLFFTEECSDNMALDLWILVPFILGYFSWRFLFVGFDFASRSTRICKEKSLSSYDDEPVVTKSIGDPSAVEIARKLRELRQEILSEKSIPAQLCQ